jgi:hypothetical protein
VVQTGGQASAAMEGAHSPGVVVLVSAASPSAERTTGGALDLDHSRTAAALQPLGTDRDAAGTEGVTRAIAGTIAPEMMTAADATSL